MKTKWYQCYFGWTNLKWNLTEIKKMYSANEISWYSKKRIESGIAFLIAQWGLVHWLILNITSIKASEICMWGGLEFAICGYVINQIQKEKTNVDNPPAPEK